MKNIYKLLEKLFALSPSFVKKVDKKDKSFFDYSAKEQVKLLRAAGRDAQQEQLKLLKTYESRFGNA